ncbi:Uncharacterised protein [Vibrio cholerae]|nr:Uncharacterised protein [Vibrio cholerae]
MFFASLGENKRATNWTFIQCRNTILIEINHSKCSTCNGFLKIKAHCGRR